MNARVSLFRARTAPSALALAIALAFVGAPAQAQYSYPGTAGSSGHYAGIHPIRAGGRGRADGANAPARLDRGNPSMQRGEACPPGSECATPVPANGGGSGHPASGYGAHESYGAASAQAPHEANAIHPIKAGGSASINPVRAGAGHSALNYGPSQSSNVNFRNGVTGKSSGPNVNAAGQPTSFNGPNGKVNMDGSQTIIGPNGQRQTIGGGPDLNNLGGGYGHQKGAGMNMGGIVNAQNGSMSMKQTGGATGMANGGVDSYKMDNGTSGEQEGDRTNKGFKSGQTGKGAKYDGFGSSVVNWFDSDSGHPNNGKDSNGTEWKDGIVWDGTDSKGTKWRNGVASGGTIPTQDEVDKRKGMGAGKGSGNGGDMPADMGPDAGPGEIVSGTGQVVHPGQKKGQDTGGGQGKDGGSTTSGGQNAQGQYIAPSGQDNVKKPKEVGALKMNYNGKNGAIDPKLNGSNGGGG